jgi:hypothetical protein
VDVFDVDSINWPESQALVRRLAPDLVVMASRELIHPDVLKLARIGFIGCHPGILPDFRGAYASFWAMHQGRTDKIGISVYLANAGAGHEAVFNSVEGYNDDPGAFVRRRFYTPGVFGRRDAPGHLRAPGSHEGADRGETNGTGGNARTSG